MNANERLKNKALEIALIEGVHDIGIENFRISRRHKITNLTKCFYNSMILYMIQGEKKTYLDNMEFSYHSGQCIVTSVSIPYSSMITQASADAPMLCVALDIDHNLIAEMIREIKFPKPEKTIQTGIGVIDADEALADAFYRLLLLKDENKTNKKILSSFIIKEIYYRLLISPIGCELRQAHTMGTQSNQIARAINWMKENYKHALNVEELANFVNMSPTSFYRNFNKVTRISPVQYQKQLRLYEAQRLMLVENVSAEHAAYTVGYESPSQFNREYKRMFGMPPKTNVNQIKNV